MSIAKVKTNRGSKNRKKAWRKVDIEDVEEFLEDKRLDERVGGAIQDRANEDLFLVDTAPDVSNLDHLKSAKKLRREVLKNDVPRCFQIIGSYSQVPDPLVKRNRVRAREERRHPLLLQKEMQCKEKGVLKQKELNAIINRRKFSLDQLKEKPQRGTVLKDVWSEVDSSINANPHLQSEWIGSNVWRHTLVGLSKSTKAPPNTLLEKPYKVPAVEAPHPGMSYNPSYTDHLDLLQTVASKELNAIKHEEHLKRVTSKMFEKVPRNKAEDQWVREMSAGIPSLDPEAALPDEIVPGEDNQLRAINPPSNRSKKKTLKTRRKMREEKERHAIRFRAKQERKKISDIHRLKHIKEGITKDQDNLLKLREKRLKKKAAYNAGTKRLGRNKFIEKDLDFNMPSDLRGSLRRVQPEGNPLLSRFTSLQKRNVLEPPTIQKLRFSKKKRFTKSAHKLPWEIDTLQIQRHSKRKPKTVAQTVLGL